MTPSTRDLARAVAERLERSGVEAAGLEAELLLGLAACASRLEVLRGLDRELRPDEAARLSSLVSARERGVPLAYLRGTQEFYGIEFEVGPSVLIPRPETELLVEFAREALSGRRAASLVDVGTGSGCIAVAVALHLPHVRVLATDLSEAALGVARRNAARHRVGDRVTLVRGSLLDPCASSSADAIASNPPYIPTGELPALQREVRDHEPRMALDGGQDGLAFQRGVISGARRVLRPGGALGLEVALGQAAAVADRLRAAGFVHVALRRDLAGIERAVTARQPG